MKYLKLFFVFVVISSFCFAQDKNVTSALNSMVESEKAFAKTSVEKGMRDAFIEYFADDGIEFSPGPTNAKEAMLKRLAGKPQFTLNWQPVYADVSNSGDFGYTTGPYTLTDNSPEKAATKYGYYFSIWKKQADGNWKVEIDCGIETPVPRSTDIPKFQAAPRIKSKVPPSSLSYDAGKADLLNVDREFLRNSQQMGLTYEYDRYMSGSARIHRNGYFPFTDKAGIHTYLKIKPTKDKWWPLKSDISKAGDLGYTYGNYEVSDPGTGRVIEKGYYVRVWQRDENGTWSWFWIQRTPRNKS